MSKIMVDLWVGFFSNPRKRIGKPLLFLKSTDVRKLQIKKFFKFFFKKYRILMVMLDLLMEFK